MAVLRTIIIIFASVLVLAGCQEDGDTDQVWQSEFPDLLREQREACERQGGRWGAAPGKTSYVCFEDLRDALKPCASSSDCDGLCLARSRSCSPIKPFFGCHEVLNSNGVQQTLCIE